MADNLFTVWTGSTPLMVVRANSLREGRQFTAADQFQRLIKRATVIGKPLLHFGDRLWVGPASSAEAQKFEIMAMDKPDIVFLWLQPVDGV